MANEGTIARMTVIVPLPALWGGYTLEQIARLQYGFFAGQSVCRGRTFLFHSRCSGQSVYDSGDILDKKAAALGIYDDSRSRDKGVEPEGISLLEITDIPTLSWVWSARSRVPWRCSTSRNRPKPAMWT